VAPSVTANPARDVRVRFTPPASVPSKPEFRDLRSREPLRGRPILHYPMPDFSKVKPKVNTYNTPRPGSKDREVSDSVACIVLQMETSNPSVIGWKI
jgi:hypothetical protein